MLNRAKPVTPRDAASRPTMLRPRIERDRASLWIAAMAALLALIVTLPAIGGAFVWDDLWLIVQSPLRGDPSRLGELLVRGHGWGVMVDPNQPSGYFRPLATLVHGLLLILVDARPLAFRLLQTLLHAAAAFLLARWLAARMPRAAWGALLFAVHPVLADAFGWVSALPDLLAGALLFAALVFFDRERPRFLPGAVCWLGALLAKESALVGVLWFRLLLGWPRLRGSDGRAAPAWGRGRTFLWLGGTLVVYLILRVAVLGLARPAGEWPPGVETSGPVLVGRLLLYNLKVMLWPFDLALAPSPWVTSGPSGAAGFSGLATGLGGLFLGVGIAVVAWWGLKRGGSAWRGLSLGVLLAGAALLPALQIVPTNDIYGGRFLYLPVAGLCAGVGFWLAAQELRARSPAVIVFGLVLLAFGLRSGLRAAEWRSEERLFGGEYRRQPIAVRAEANWGGWLLRQGRTDEARPVIEGLARRLPDAPQVRLLTALLRLNEGRVEEAEPVFEELRRTWRRTPTLTANLAACRLRRGHYEEGLALLDEATRNSSPTSGMRNNRGLALQMLGRVDEALREFAAAAADDPHYQPARINRIRLLATEGEVEAARAEGGEFLRRFPGSPHSATVRAVLDTLAVRSR